MDHFLTFIIHFFQTCLITNINNVLLIAFEVELAIEKLKCYKSPGIYQIPAEVEQFAIEGVEEKI
jgi:hypothetical protein